jgi:molybdopterin-guanine dinucleotide biosynthesis protein A
VAATGFAVAGGESRRMGRDKALLPWGESTLLDHALDRLCQASAAVRILCGPTRRYEDRGVPVDTDVVPGAGPLGGLLTGLLQLGDAPGLFLAVDLPHVPAALLRRLVHLAAGHDAVVPVTAAGPEPLCAVYRASCLEAVRRCVDAGQLRMTSFWPDVRVREVRESEIAAYADPGRAFRNVNTPGEYAAERAGA